MEINTAPVRKRRSGSTKSPTAGALSRYLATKTAKSAIDLMILCASTGDNHWDTVMDPEMASIISESKEIEEKFLTNLCKHPGLPHAHNVISAFLTHASEETKKRFFSPSALKKKNHPASLCFYGASFSSPSGINLTKVLGALIEHGLSVDTIIARNMSNLERAASLGHRDLLKIITPHLSEFPEDVIKFVLTKGMHPIESISILIDECDVPITVFSTVKMLNCAKEEARCYINARLSRMRRIAEAELDDDAFEEFFVEQERPGPSEQQNDFPTL